MHRTRIALVLALGACLLAGCGGGGSFSVSYGGKKSANTAEVKAQLLQAQRAKTPNLQVGDAACPSSVPLQNGERFTCTVLLEGVQAPYAVTLYDVNQDTGSAHFRLQPAKPIIDVTKIVAFIHKQLQTTAPAAKVDCGAAKVQVVAVGAAISCTVTDGANTTKVQAVVKDLDGTVTLRS